MQQWRWPIALGLGLLTTNAAAQSGGASPVAIERIDDDLFVLTGAGVEAAPGNSLVSIGAQGVLLVDAQSAELGPALERAIATLGGGPVDVVISTHWHDAHAGGYEALAAGAQFLAHERSRSLPAQPESRAGDGRTEARPAVRPVISYAERLSYHFNGQRVDLLHVAPAHTAGDTVVLFRDRNTVALGDVFAPSAYPVVDADHGGDLDGMIEFCRAVLAQIDGNTVIVPGHGPLARRPDLEAFVDMLVKVRARIAALVEAGASREQVLAANVTREWNAARGDPVPFVERVYASLQR